MDSTFFLKGFIYFLYEISIVKPTFRDAFCLATLLAAILVFSLRRFYFDSKKRAVYIDGKVGTALRAVGIEGENGRFLPSLREQLRRWRESTVVRCSSSSRDRGVFFVWVPLPQRFQPIHCVIYTGDTCSSEEILETTKVLASFFTIHNRRESCTSTSSLLSISNSCVSPSEPGWRPSTTPISRCFSSPWRPCWSCWKGSVSSFPTFSWTQPASPSRIPSPNSSLPLAFSPTRTIRPLAPTCCIASSIARPNSTTTRLLLLTPSSLY